MFSKQIIDSDAFLEMPLSTQALYFHLSMRADDDGFVDNPKKIQRMVSASGDDLKLLIAKRYILIFDSGVIVIKHWRIHNTLKTDRYKETVYIEEKAMLDIKKNKSYTEKNKLKEVEIQQGNQVITEWNQNGTTLETQVSIDKISIDIDKKEIKHKFGEFDHVRLKESESNKLIAELGQETFDKCIKKLDEYIQETGKKYKDHNLTIRRWVIDAVKQPEKAQSKLQPKSTNKFNNFPQRSYTAEEYAAVERAAMNRGRQ